MSYLLHYAVFNDNVNIAILYNALPLHRTFSEGYNLRMRSYLNGCNRVLYLGTNDRLNWRMDQRLSPRLLLHLLSVVSSYNVIFLDEFAFIPNHIADDFFASVYPTISSGKSTKVLIVSTPKGMNHFYRMWHDAEKGKNEYIPTDVHWSEVPGRDAKWKAQTIANTSEQQFKVEFECEFLGSVDTLISAPKLRSMTYDDPIKRNAGLDVYKEPIKDHNYIMTWDVARGVEKDYSHLLFLIRQNFHINLAQNIGIIKSNRCCSQTSLKMLQYHIIEHSF